MTDIVMTKETKPKNPILKKYVSFYEGERFRTDRWSYIIHGYGVYNGELTPREIVRNYYLKGHGTDVG